MLALKAGVDIDMMAGAYRDGLPVALERGLVTMAEIDECRAPRAAAQGSGSGLFDDPVSPRRAAGGAGDDDRGAAQLAREVARARIVLLKNDSDACR